MAKTEMIYENLLPHSISEISLLHRKIGVHTSLTFSTKKWTIRKIWCPCLEKPNRTIDAWFFGGEGNDLSNDHHNSIENVIKNFSFFCAFMDSLLGHHMPNVYITYCRPLSRQFMQIDYDNRARNADFASNMSFAFFSMDHSEQNSKRVISNFSTGFVFLCYIGVKDRLVVPLRYFLRVLPLIHTLLSLWQFLIVVSSRQT